MKNIGDKVKTKVRNYGKTLKVEGTIKDIRSSYGKMEYLVTNGKIEDFWIRPVDNS